METKIFSERETMHLLQSAVTIAVTEVLGRTGAIKPTLDKNEAYRIYGRSNVDRWIEKKMVSKRQAGRNMKWQLDRAELETARASDLKISRIFFKGE